MVEEFSAGYYLLRLYVEPHSGDRPALNRAAHAELSEEVYPGGLPEGEPPLLVKVDETHVAVQPDAAVPDGTLALPDPILQRTRIDTPPTLREILVAKAEQATRLLDLFDPSLPAWNPT